VDEAAQRVAHDRQVRVAGRTRVMKSAHTSGPLTTASSSSARMKVAGDP